LKEKKEINVGDLVKKTVNPGKGRFAVVVAQGEEQNQKLLSNWVRVRYAIDNGYEWIQKSGIQKIIKE
jgi:hypothetical protein